LKKFRKEMLVAAVVAAAILAGRMSFAWGRLFTFIDAALVTSAFLVFTGRLRLAYAAAMTNAAVDDILFMPFFGVHFFTAAAYVSLMAVLYANLYSDNLITRVFITAAAKVFACFTGGVLVFVFLWGFKPHYLSAQAVPGVLFTSAAAALVFKLAEIPGKGRAVWSRKT